MLHFPEFCPKVMLSSTPLCSMTSRICLELSRPTSANYKDYPKSVTNAQPPNDKTLFAEKFRIFDLLVADASIRSLVDSFTDYKASIIFIHQCLVNVTTTMDTFFALQDRFHMGHYLQLCSI